MKGEFEWKTGTPTEYGEYLVLCQVDGGYQINRDVWFDDGRGWQSRWHNMVAWCHFNDIKLKK